MPHYYELEVSLRDLEPRPWRRAEPFPPAPPDDTAPRFARESLVWFPAGAARVFELDLQVLFRWI
jgi:hypothetical protein